MARATAGMRQWLTRLTQTWIVAHWDRGAQPYGRASRAPFSLLLPVPGGERSLAVQCLSLMHAWCCPLSQRAARGRDWTGRRSADLAPPRGSGGRAARRFRSSGALPSHPAGAAATASSPAVWLSVFFFFTARVNETIHPSGKKKESHTAGDAVAAAPAGWLGRAPELRKWRAARPPRPPRPRGGARSADTSCLSSRGLSLRYDLSAAGHRRRWWCIHEIAIHSPRALGSTSRLQLSTFVQGRRRRLPTSMWRVGGVRPSK